MKKLTLLLLTAVLLLAACRPSPQNIVDSWQAALNNGDIDEALSYLAEDAVITISPAGPEGDAIFTGHSEIRGWYETIVAGNGVTTMSDCKVDDETIICLDTFSDEGLKSLGVDFIEGEWVAVVRDGKIQSYTFTITPASLAKLPPPPEPTAEPTIEPTPTPTTDPIVQQLVGKYLTTITIEESRTSPGIDQGDYLLKLQFDMRWFVTDISGFVFVQGYYTVTADQIVFETKGGAAATCIGGFGTYKWAMDGQTLTLTAIKDDCPGGKFFFTIHPFVKQP